MHATANGSAKKLVNSAEVAAALRLFIPDGGVAEVRVLDATTRSDSWRPATFSGYFDDPEMAATALTEIQTAKGIYFTLNELDPSILARAANRLRKSEKGDATGDKHVVRRRWLLIDLDAVRISGISATDAEVAQSIQRSQEIDLYLHDRGWPDPVVCDSGNGRHLYYRIDLPDVDDGLVERCLAALSKVFSDSVISIDTSVFNPSRITKLFGTLVCKGDSTPDRPHRFAKIVSVPDLLQVVSLEQLEELAGPATIVAPKPAANGHNHNGAAFDVAGFLARNNFDVTESGPWEGGSRWEFRVSPMCEHGGDGPFIIQHASGAISAGCHHDSCKGHWGWSDLRARFEPKPERAFDGGDRYAAAATVESTVVDDFPRFTLGELTETFRTLSPPVIHGLLREGETANFIANPKVGKSWAMYGLAINIATGHDWLGVFPVARGRVLIVDNELHPQTLAHRIPAVGSAMGMPFGEYRDRIDTWCLRGNLRSLNELLVSFRKLVQPGEYKLIILDAKYRFAAQGASENDNAAETLVYNLLDQIAAETKSAVLVVHHASKGSQSDKRVTDVGSGAGAQSRAADCHMVLREHEDEGVTVLDAAVRSFAPVEPLALRWSFPVFIPDEFADARKLKGQLSHQEQKQVERDKEACDKIIKALMTAPATARQLREKTGLSRERQQRLLDRLVADDQLKTSETDARGNQTKEYSVVLDVGDE